MKLYTGTGDDGDTGLLGGRRISKGSELIAAIGHLDELNATIGLVRSHPQCRAQPLVDQVLKGVQSDLFEIGTRLAATEDQAGGIGPEDIQRIETAIDALSESTPPLRSFILPGGAETASRLHVARAVARRTERAVVRVADAVDFGPHVPVYLNRLSDLLFAAARFMNTAEDTEEEPWHKRP